MEKLKIGDNVCLINSRGYSRFTSYTFSKVVRLTSTLAILEDGSRIKNDPRKSFSNNRTIYQEQGTYNFWEITTPEIIENAKTERLKIKIHNWFEEKKFTDSEKEIIYNYFTK